MSAQRSNPTRISAGITPSSSANSNSPAMRSAIEHPRRMNAALRVERTASAIGRCRIPLVGEQLPLPDRVRWHFWRESADRQQHEAHRQRLLAIGSVAKEVRLEVEL